MQHILGEIGLILLAILPDWVRLPSLTFTLPHWAYWAGLILFPLVSMYMVQRAEASRTSKRVSLPVAYLFWFWGGLAGLHRFYVGAYKMGLVFVSLFILILYGNTIGTKARDHYSAVNNELKIANFMLKRAEKDLAKGRSGAQEKVDTAKSSRDQNLTKVDAAKQEHEKWRALVGGAFALIILLLIIDLFLLPALTKAADSREANLPPPADYDVMERGVRGDERDKVTFPLLNNVSQVSDWTGNFVAYWSVIAVFVYYYEVVARYVFNSPTNWAHESMFLMFGMQYLLSGAYALKENSHVRVDVIYANFSTRTKTKIDVVTSLFFLTFTLTLLITGAIFAWDSFSVLEVSFTEWAIQYWPVKFTITIGAALLLAQGVMRLARDIVYLRQTSPQKTVG